MGCGSQSDVDTFFHTNMEGKHQTEEHSTMSLSLAMVDLVGVSKTTGIPC